MFTKEEKAFLQQHGIAANTVLDVRGHRPVAWKRYAKEKDFPFVLRDPR